MKATAKNQQSKKQLRFWSQVRTQRGKQLAYTCYVKDRQTGCSFVNCFEKYDDAVSWCVSAIIILRKSLATNAEKFIAN